MDSTENIDTPAVIFKLDDKEIFDTALATQERSIIANG
ncbi:hypothetical protein SAMN06295900_108151 [Trinickia caryophylli]|uniref:Uncharacterized protein n=1 Tax=Trinickia caryophylli TaxID=28094 RepID=A0A1X7FB90_TRICW|nr:hypothetical protein SAMN06295900_108151 [Trinickia caryophylli]